MLERVLSKRLDEVPPSNRLPKWVTKKKKIICKGIGTGLSQRTLAKYSMGIMDAIITQTPRFAQAQNSVNTREFCMTSNNGKDFIFNYVARVLTKHVASTNHKTRTCCFYIQYGINQTIIRASFRVSIRYDSPPAPWNNEPYSH